MLHSLLRRTMVIAAVLVMALPTLAWADPGNGNGNGNSGNQDNGNNGGGNGNNAGGGNDSSNGNGNGNSGGNNGNGNGNGGGNANANGNGGGNGNGIGRETAPGQVRKSGASGGGSSASSGAGSAQPQVVTLDQQSALNAVRSARAMPLEAIVNIVRKSAPGELIDAKLIEVSGTLIYEIRLLETGGKVERLYYYARSGRRVVPR